MVDELGLEELIDTLIPQDQEQRRVCVATYVISPSQTLRRTCVVFTLKLPYLEGKNGVVIDSRYEKSTSVNPLYCESIIDFTNIENNFVLLNLHVLR